MATTTEGRYKNSARPGTRAAQAQDYGRIRSHYIVRDSEQQGNPNNNHDTRFFDMALKASAGQLFVKDVPEVILKNYFSFLGQSPDFNRKILIEEIPDEIKNHISFKKGVENWERQLEGKIVREGQIEDAFTNHFYDYDRGVVAAETGTPLSRISKTDLINSEFMQGYNDALDFISINSDNNTLNNESSNRSGVNYKFETKTNYALYDIGFQHYLDGGDEDSLQVNKYLIQGYRDARDLCLFDGVTLPLTRDEEMFNLGIEWALEKKMIDEAPDEYRYNTSFLDGYDSMLNSHKGRKR